MKPTGPIHIVMRFSDAFMSVDDTIEEHRLMIRDHGACWIGKVGKPLAAKNIQAINAQVAEGTKSYLLLVQNTGAPGRSEYSGYKGSIVEMRERIPEDEQELTPEYYEDQNILRAATLWTKLSRITAMERGALSEYKVASSGISLPTTLRKSMAALFVVCEGKGLTS